jgi:hypothetical protein
MSQWIERGRDVWAIDAFLRVACSVVLAATACLKLVAFWQEGGLQAIHGASGLLVGVSVAELTVAALLISCPNRLATRIGSLGLCAAFLGASSMAMRSSERCGCFGDLTLLPLDRLLVASSLFLGVLLCNYLRTAARSWRQLLWVIPVFALAGGLVEEVSPDSLAASVTPTASVVDLLPRNLRRGSWHVIVIRPGCPACRDFLETMPRIRRSDKTEDRPYRALLVLGQDLPWLIPFRQDFDHSWSVADSRDIHIQTPSEFMVIDGQLVASRGEEHRGGA